MKDLRTILEGIVIILSSLFLLGVCILSSEKGAVALIAEGLFVVGLVVTLAGFHNSKLDD